MMSGKRALGSGISGAVAMSMQVTTMMWIRTTMNYQYKNGGSMTAAFRSLYREGGSLRFYRGYFAAMTQAPLARFGDTAANMGVLTLLGQFDSTRTLDPALKTAAASASVGVYRLLIMPIDAVKTSMQVGGKDGFAKLATKISTSGVGVLWHGAFASTSATIVGHYPWFATFNYLNARWPRYEDMPLNLGRSAAIGFTCSVVSDTISNSIRVVKTVRQTNETPISYANAIQNVVEKDGVMGLFGRGLQTRLLANGIQGLVFTVVWQYMDEMLFGGHNH